MSIGMERSQIWPRNKGENSELNTSRKYNSEAFVRFCHLFAFISQYLRYSTSISLTIKHSWNIFALRELLFLVSETRVRGSISRRGRGGHVEEATYYEPEDTDLHTVAARIAHTFLCAFFPSDTEIFTGLLNLHQPHQYTVLKKE